MSNAEIMKNAREALKGKWGLAIGGSVLYTLIAGAASYTWVLSLIIGGPLAVGYAIFTLKYYRGEEAQIEHLFEGFKNFANALVAYLLMSLYVILWALLLIIPGIIAAFAYSQTFYILAENPELKGSEVLKKSKEMMQGNKWKLFCLGWRFFGWFLLSILTLGIGLLWLLPYMQVSYAGFYEELKKQK